MGHNKWQDQRAHNLDRPLDFSALRRCFARSLAEEGIEPGQFQQVFSNIFYLTMSIINTVLFTTRRTLTLFSPLLLIPASISTASRAGFRGMDKNIEEPFWTCFLNKQTVSVDFFYCMYIVATVDRICSLFGPVNRIQHLQLLTAKETAGYLRIPLPTVYYLMQRGRLPAVQIGGRWRIKKTALDQGILRQARGELAASLPNGSSNGDLNHDLLTVRETAVYLRIPLPTVYYLMQRGRIPAIRIGGRWRIQRSLLDSDILKQNKQGPPAVLVIHQDPETQELFKIFLKKSGCGRVVVGTLRAAISSMAQQRFDFMFLDMALVGATLNQIHQRAKHLNPDLHTIVVISYPEGALMNKILEFSPITILKKPVKIEQLAQIIKVLGHPEVKVAPQQILPGRTQNNGGAGQALQVRRRQPKRRGRLTEKGKSSTGYPIKNPRT